MMMFPGALYFQGPKKGDESGPNECWVRLTVQKKSQTSTRVSGSARHSYGSKRKLNKAIKEKGRETQCEKDKREREMEGN